MQQHKLEITSIRELAELYRGATKVSPQLAGVVEAAAFRLATAESAAMQADALRRFAAFAGA